MSLLGSESTESRAETEPREAGERQRKARSEEVPPRTHSTSFKLARVLFGGILAFMAVDNLRNLEGRIQYAEGKGAPMAETTVPFVSGSLLFGGLGIAAWKLPRLAAGAAATFFVSVTPFMHDFWSIEDDDEKQQQMIHFLKNAALLGGTLAFLRVAQDDRKTE